MFVHLTNLCIPIMDLGVNLGVQIRKGDNWVHQILPTFTGTSKQRDVSGIDTVIY